MMGTTSVQERLSVLNAAFEQERRASSEENRPASRELSAQIPIANGRRKSVQFTARPTIVFDSATKSYGKVAVLRNINITVKENTVYGLYGKSGSGKSTALCCLLGLQNLDSGSIYVRGFSTGTKLSGVPGKRIGYMPQSASSLHEDFSFKETLHYFGRFYGMKYDDVEDKRKSFTKLLNLDTCKGLIRHFRPEEKQLVSFVIALIHQPEILVMDEPTLGMDPLAREIVWQHVRELVAESKTTVVIASLSPYEVNMADTVGILRNGKLVSEASPATMLSKYETNSLEDAILKLCQDDNKNRSSQSRWNSIGVPAKDKESGLSFIKVSKKPLPVLLRQSSWNVGKRDFTRVVDKLQALVLKNVIFAYRSLWLILFMSILPAATIGFVSIALNFAPKDIKFGFVSNESTAISFSEVNYEKALDLDDCEAFVSCQFLKRLQRERLDLILFHSEIEARESVIDGNIGGYLTILPEFTTIVDEGTITDSRNGTNGSGIVKVILDTSNPFVASWIKNVISSNLQAVVFDYSSPNNFHNGPILYESITFGGDDYNFSSFNVPAVTIHVISFYASIISALLLMHEEGDGKFERIATIGIYYCDILLAHFSILTFLLLIQTLLAYFTIFYFLQLPNFGSALLGFCLTITDGISGVAFGVLVASICRRGQLPVLILVAAAIPAFFISGTVIPMEGLPLTFKYAGYIYPGTLSGLGLKNILLRGWGLSYSGIWIAFGSSFAYSAAYLLFTYINRLIV